MTRRRMSRKESERSGVGGGIEWQGGAGTLQEIEPRRPQRTQRKERQDRADPSTLADLLFSFSFALFVPYVVQSPSIRDGSCLRRLANPTGGRRGRARRRPLRGGGGLPRTARRSRRADGG